MKTKPGKLEAKHHFWEAHFRQWKGSGLSQAEYCRTRTISVKSFVYWKRKFTGEVPFTSLVEVPVLKTIQLTSCSKPVCLKIGNKYSIEIERGFDPETLDLILEVVENR